MSYSKEIVIMIMIGVAMFLLILVDWKLAPAMLLLFWAYRLGD